MGVNGPAIGGGFELALMADVVYASEDASFSLPGIHMFDDDGWMVMMITMLMMVMINDVYDNDVHACGN